MAYRNHEGFVAPARQYPQLWRLLVGLVVAVIVYIVVVAAIFVLAWVLSGVGGDGLAWAQRQLNPDDPNALLLLLSTFAGMALGAMAAARLMHKRSAATLFGRAAVTMHDFVVAMLVVGTILGASVVVWSFSYDAVPGLPFGPWLSLLPLAILGLLIQTGAEELLFRGYLQQQLAARFATPIVWMVVPSILFGLVHYDAQSAGSSVWIVVGAAALFGLIAADLTAHTGSLGAAWGFHFANNTLAVLVISTEGSLTGLALYKTPYAVSDTDTLSALVLVDLAMMLLAWIVIRRLLSR
ncbi:MAG: CPBP family intramembrane glutamic endopeptidase [Pseudomonadota bacterium]